MKKIIQTLFFGLFLFCLIGSYAQQRNIVNPSFEQLPDPWTAGTGPSFYHHNDFEGWNTTANGENGPVIEIWPANNYENNPSNDGAYFAEINAYEFAALYQDICLLEGEQFDWSFNHLGREGLDSMLLTIDGVEQKRFGTRENEWKTYTGTYVLTGASKSVRFSFEALSTSTGDATTGNFLDNVQISGLKAYPFFGKEIANITEGSGDRVKLLVSGDVNQVSSVELEVLVSSTATDGSDFKVQSLMVEVPIGKYDGTATTGIEIPIDIIDDGLVESVEQIDLKIVGVSGGIQFASNACKPIKLETHVEIIDNDCPGGTQEVCLGEDVSFTFSHNSPSVVNWFDKLGGDIIKSNDATFTYKPTATPDTVYAEGIYFGAPDVNVSLKTGKEYSSSWNNADNVTMPFEAHTSFLINSFKVQAACDAGTKSFTFELFKNGTSTGLTHDFTAQCNGTGNTPMLETVEVNWFVQPGTGYEIRAIDDNELMVWNDWNRGSGPWAESFPFDDPAITIRNTVNRNSLGAFQDWEVTLNSTATCTAEFITTSSGADMESTVDVTYPKEVCEGQAFEITVVDGGTSNSWDVQNASNHTISGTNNTKAAIIAGNKDIEIEISSGVGCASDTSFTITVNAKPTASIASVAAVCAGEKTTMTASGGDSYTWYDNTNGLEADKTANPITFKSTNSLIGDNTFSVEVVGDKGCKDSVDVIVSVLALPTASIAPVAAVCAGEKTTITASGGDSYTWYDNTNGLEADKTANPITFNSTNSLIGDNTFSVEVVDDNGCKDSVDVIVSVLALPTASIAPVAGICVGETTTLTASGGNTYTWYGNTNGLESPLTKNPITFESVVGTDSLVGNNLFNVEVTDNNGCKDSTNIAVIVQQLPDVSITASAKKICKGDNVTLTGSNAQSYIWQDMVVDGEAFTPNNTATYKVEGTDNNGCKNTATILIEVLDDPQPAVSITHDGVFCVGKQITFSIASQQFLGDAPTYSWIKNGETAVGGNTATLQLSDLENGDKVQLSVISNEICLDVNSSTVQSNEELVEVYGYPQLVIDPTKEICVGSTDFIKVEETTGLSSNLFWYKVPDLNTVKGTGDNLEITTESDAGSYVVVAANDDNTVCSVTSSPINVSFISPSLTLSVSKSEIPVGESVAVTASTNVTDFTWSSDNTTLKDLQNEESLVLTAALNTTTTFTFLGNTKGCVVSKLITVKVLEPYTAPYLFSPNGDGNNDIWVIAGLEDYSNYRIRIYNRWGNVVHEFNNNFTSWDGSGKSGKELPDGVYYYVIEAAIGDNIVPLSGYVTIVR